MNDNIFKIIFYFIMLLGQLEFLNNCTIMLVPIIIVTIAYKFHTLNVIIILGQK